MKTFDSLFSLPESAFEIVVYNDSVETSCESQLFRGFGHSLFYGFRRVCAARYKPFSECLNRRRLDEDGKSMSAIKSLYVYAAFYVYVEQDYVPFIPYPLHFAVQSAVIRACIDLFILYEFPVFYLLLEFLFREKIVVGAVFFAAPGFSAGGRN